MEPHIEFINTDLSDELKAMLYQDFNILPDYDYVYADLRKKNSSFYIALDSLDRTLYLPFYYKQVYIHVEMF